MVKAHKTWWWFSVFCSDQHQVRYEGWYGSLVGARWRWQERWQGRWQGRWQDCALLLRGCQILGVVFAGVGTEQPTHCGTGIFVGFLLHRDDDGKKIVHSTLAFASFVLSFFVWWQYVGGWYGGCREEEQWARWGEWSIVRRIE